MFQMRILFAILLYQIAVLSASYIHDQSSSIHSESGYSKKSSSNNGKGYSYHTKKSNHRGPREDLGFSLFPLGLDGFSYKYASNYDNYYSLPLDLDLDFDLDVDFDTDLDYDNYYDYDLDYDPDLDPDFIKYKYRLYGLNHFTLHGPPYYNDLKFSRRFKKFSRRPYYHRYNYRIHHKPHFSNYDFDLDGWGLGKYGLGYGYDKYSIGFDDVSHYLSHPTSYVKVKQFF